MADQNRPGPATGPKTLVDIAGRGPWSAPIGVRAVHGGRRIIGSSGDLVERAETVFRSSQARALDDGPALTEATVRLDDPIRVPDGPGDWRSRIGFTSDAWDRILLALSDENPAGHGMTDMTGMPRTLASLERAARGHETQLHSIVARETGHDGVAVGTPPHTIIPWMPGSQVTHPSDPSPASREGEYPESLADWNPTLRPVPGTAGRMAAPSVAAERDHTAAPVLTGHEADATRFTLRALSGIALLDYGIDFAPSIARTERDGYLIDPQRRNVIFDVPLRGRNAGPLLAGDAARALAAVAWANEHPGTTAADAKAAGHGTGDMLLVRAGLADRITGAGYDPWCDLDAQDLTDNLLAHTVPERDLPGPVLTTVDPWSAMAAPAPAPASATPVAGPGMPGPRLSEDPWRPMTGAPMPDPLAHAAPAPMGPAPAGPGM